MTLQSQHKRFLENYHMTEDFYDNIFSTRHWIHLFIGTTVCILFLTTLLAYVFVKKRRKSAAVLKSQVPRISCSVVTIGSHLFNQQPELQVHAVRIKPRGLLDRRSSSTSLTIDLQTSSEHFDSHGGPPKDCSSEEFLLSAGNRMTRQQLCNCLKVPKVLHHEFLELPMNHECKRAEWMAGCSVKNRFDSIWPNFRNRVQLQASTSTQRYINANYIRGYNEKPKAYIATQGPMSNTIDDFWSMIWHENCTCIVMLTKLIEMNNLGRPNIKCESYLPDNEGLFGNIRVIVKSVKRDNGFFVKNLVLKKGELTKHVKHMWLVGWSDQMVPNLDQAQQVLDLVAKVEMCTTFNALNSGPVVVHCSAGLGRTGCFIGVCIGCQQLRKENMVDVLAIVCQLRIDRGGMVQTPEQYEFLHQALALYES